MIKKKVSTVLKNTANGRKIFKLSEATHIEEKQHSGAHPLAINLSTSSNITVTYISTTT